MTLDQARKDIEEGWLLDSTLADLPSIIVCSGGLRSSMEAPVPALYASEEMAVKEWWRAVVSALDPQLHSAMRWVSQPEICQWQMTVQDSRGTHRLSTTRYSVSCRISLRENSVKLPSEGSKSSSGKIIADTPLENGIPGPS